MSIKTVLFDCGGVLAPDTWETVLLHEQKGLVRTHISSPEAFIGKVRHVWAKYAVMPVAEERDFWIDMSASSGIPLDHHEIEQIKQELIQPNPGVIPAFEYLKTKGVRIGLITNSTVFFFNLQKRLLPIDDYIKPSLVFASHEQKVEKSRGLFEIAAKAVEPSKTLIIDDRQPNIDHARRLGFVAEYYSMHEGKTLIDIVQQLTV